MNRNWWLTLDCRAGRYEDVVLVLSQVEGGALDSGDQISTDAAVDASVHVRTIQQRDAVLVHLQNVLGEI